MTGALFIIIVDCFLYRRNVAAPRTNSGLAEGTEMGVSAVNLMGALPMSPAGELSLRVGCRRPGLVGGLFGAETTQVQRARPGLRTGHIGQ